MGYFLTTACRERVAGKSSAHPKTHTPSSRVKERGLRFYSPNLGRWLSRDPIEERGGWNRYTACGNNCINALDALGLVSAGLVTGEKVQNADCPDWASGGADGMFGYTLRVQFRHDDGRSKVLQFIDVHGWYVNDKCERKNFKIEFWEWFQLQPTSPGASTGATPLGLVSYYRSDGMLRMALVDEHSFGPDMFNPDTVVEAYLKLDASYGIGEFTGEDNVGFGVLDMPVAVEPTGLLSYVTPGTVRRRGTANFTPPINTWTETYHFAKKGKCCITHDIDRVTLSHEHGGEVPPEEM